MTVRTCDRCGASWDAHPRRWTLQEDLLRMNLEVAVPLEIPKASVLPDEANASMIQNLTATTDERMFAHSASTGRRFVALVQGLACLAQQPQGVIFLGMHWCC